MARRPTIIDVARRAGVSKSTVSLVLQNSQQVRGETKTLIRSAMAEIGYVYNRAAAQMRSSNTGLIGLVINDLRNPFFTEFATSVQMALADRGYAAVVANVNEDANIQSQVLAAMIEHGVSALIISPAYGESGGSFDAIARAAVPAMQVLRKVDPRVELFPFAAPDYLQGGRLATRHLLEESARRIAFVGGLEGRPVTRERMSGYIEELDRAGARPLILTGNASRSFGRDAALRLETEYPEVDGVVCFNDLVALGMLSGCAQTGREVGSDLKIAGFDDIEECAQIYPTLTSVRCDIAGFGERIATTVLNWLEEDEVPVPELRTEVELMVRQSSVRAQGRSS